MDVRVTIYLDNRTIYSFVAGYEEWEPPLGEWTDQQEINQLAHLEGLAQSDDCPPELFFRRIVRVTAEKEQPNAE